jgi:hypothetical protein
MKTCRISGSTSAESRPIFVLSRGTSRQPSSRCPSSATVSTMIRSQVSRRWGSRGRNSIPTP